MNNSIVMITHFIPEMLSYLFSTTIQNKTLSLKHFISGKSKQKPYRYLDILLTQIDE